MSTTEKRLAGLIQEYRQVEKDKQVYTSEANARLKSIRQQMEGLSDGVMSGQADLFNPEKSKNETRDDDVN